jgi:hypothetical protein
VQAQQAAGQAIGDIEHGGQEGTTAAGAVLQEVVRILNDDDFGPAGPSGVFALPERDEVGRGEGVGLGDGQYIEHVGVLNRGFPKP